MNLSTDATQPPYFGAPAFRPAKRSFVSDPRSASRAQIEHLFVSPGHNYFGRHGFPAGEHPLVEVEEISCVAGRGIEGDRFFDYRSGYKGQITFFSAEVFEALSRELGLHSAHPSATRRNVITRGIDLNALIGVEFEIQGVRFAGTEECRPCYWMDRALGPGAEERMKGRGGLRAQILTGGILRRLPAAQRQAIRK